jgi:ketosteroid isomerase-like protein
VSDIGNVTIIERSYEHLGNGDILKLLDLLTDDVQWSYPGPSTIPFAGTRSGHDGVAEYFALLGETLRLDHFEPREYVAQGDTVVVLGTGRGHVLSTGRSFEQDWAHVHTLRDGRTATFRAFEDTAALMRALGVD